MRRKESSNAKGRCRRRDIHVNLAQGTEWSKRRNKKRRGLLIVQKGGGRKKSKERRIPEEEEERRTSTIKRRRKVESQALRVNGRRREGQLLV